MDKDFLVVANWKANNINLAEWFGGLTIVNEKVEIAIAAAFNQIGLINSQITEGHPEINLAAQNVSSFETGAFTGEVSAQMLKSFQVKYCLVGHSERRKYFHETNDDVSLKFDNLIKEGITPILCAQHFSEIPIEAVNQSKDIVYIMYEPFSAISSQGQYNPEPVETIAQTLVDWQAKLPQNVKFLYGGSVNPQNAKTIIFACGGLSGFVVGHASLNPIIFSSVVNSITK